MLLSPHACYRIRNERFSCVSYRRFTCVLYFWADTRLDGIQSNADKLLTHNGAFLLRSKSSFSPDSTLLVTASADKTVKTWTTSDLGLVSTFKDEKQKWVWDAVFSLDNEHIISASSDGTARLWSVHDKTVRREYIGHQKAITALAFADSVA